jgi:hypothetical protein
MKIVYFKRRTTPLELCARIGCNNFVKRGRDKYCSRSCYADSMVKNEKPRRRCERIAKPVKVARGSRKGELIQTMVSFDIETFTEIRDRAITQNMTFVDQLRLLVEWGLENETEASHPQSDRQRPKAA